MNGEKVNILGVAVDKITMRQAVDQALSMIESGRFHSIFTPNPEIIWRAQKDSELMDILNSADILIPDGIGVVIGSRIVKNPLPQRVPGFDFVCRLLEQKGTKFFLFGSAPGVARQAAKEISAKYPHAIIAGTEHGYFTEDDTPAIVERINKSGADVLLVCLGVPKQEKWIYENRHKLLTPVCIGAGGTLDGLAGTVKRAPLSWQKLNLEWLYRCIKEPKRFKRQTIIPLFILKVLFSKKTNKKGK